MTDPNGVFRRPDPREPDGSPPVPPASSSQQVTAPQEPVILDPEFHQGVWKPWEEPEDATPITDGDQPNASKASSRHRVAAMVATIGVGVALLVAVILPQFSEPTSYSFMPVVEDIMTEPEIAWSADIGQRCYPQLDADHAVMWDSGRVWSLDLRDGETRWHVDRERTTLGVTCLPGANLVAVTELDDGAGEPASRISLLDGSTGRTVADVPVETTQVIPLGENIGLVNQDNMLSAVEPGNLDEPLWSRELPGTGGVYNEIYAHQVDDTAAQLWSFVGDETVMTVVSYADGETPPWSQSSSDDEHYFWRFDDVILRFGTGSERAAVVLDPSGEELWDFADAEPLMSGSRLYAVSQASGGASSRGREIRQVDPRTGEPLNDHVFNGVFGYPMAAPQGRVAVVQGTSLKILDEQLQVQGTEAVVGDYGWSCVGEELLYTGRETQLSAIDPDGSDVVWEFPLEPGQHVEQMGRHLVVMDPHRGRIHGLRSTS